VRNVSCANVNAQVSPTFVVLSGDFQQNLQVVVGRGLAASVEANCSLGKKLPKFQSILNIEKKSLNFQAIGAILLRTIDTTIEFFSQKLLVIVLALLLSVNTIIIS
jgi:hypothetical protein